MKLCPHCKLRMRLAFEVKDGFFKECIKCGRRLYPEDEDKEDAEK